MVFDDEALVSKKELEQSVRKFLTQLLNFFAELKILIKFIV